MRENFRIYVQISGPNSNFRTLQDKFQNFRTTPRPAFVYVKYCRCRQKSECSSDKDVNSTKVWHMLVFLLIIIEQTDLISLQVYNWLTNLNYSYTTLLQAVNSPLLVTREKIPVLPIAICPKFFIGLPKIEVRFFVCNVLLKKLPTLICYAAILILQLSWVLFNASSSFSMSSCVISPSVSVSSDSMTLCKSCTIIIITRQVISKNS